MLHRPVEIATQSGLSAGANKKKTGAADHINRTAPLLLRHLIVTNYWTRLTVTGTGRQIVLQTGE